MPEEFRVDLYWSFRSPHSYLAPPRVKRLAAEYPVQWRVRIVYPLAIRTPGHFRHMDQGEHLARAAGRAGLDLGEMERAIAADPAPRKALILAHEAKRPAAACVRGHPPNGDKAA